MKYANGIFLSDGQWKTLKLLAKGCRAATIAEIIGTSEGMVRRHFSQLKRKLGATTNCEVVHRAWIFKLLDDKI